MSLKKEKVPAPDSLSLSPGPRSVLRGAEVRLRAAVVILRRGIVVTVMMMLVIVVLRGGVVIVMVVLVILDVSVGKQERGGGRRRLVRRRQPWRQAPVTLDRAIPAGCCQLGRGGEETESERGERVKKRAQQ